MFLRQQQQVIPIQNLSNFIWSTGVTIQSPQLDINTVAAGGGSRLFFKNKIFVVGPESAGAHPGGSESSSFLMISQDLYAIVKMDIWL